MHLDFIMKTKRLEQVYDDYNYNSDDVTACPLSYRRRPSLSPSVNG